MANFVQSWITQNAFIDFHLENLTSSEQKQHETFVNDFNNFLSVISRKVPDFSLHLDLTTIGSERDHLIAKRWGSVPSPHLSHPFYHQASALSREDLANRLLKVPPVLMSKQLALLQREYFLHLRPTELLKSAFSKPDKHQNAPNVLNMIEHVNQLCHAVVTSVVTAPSLKRRVTLLTRWVEVAEACLSSPQDFNSLTG